MHYRDNTRPDGVIRRGVHSAQNEAFDGRFLGLLLARVTDIKDRDRQRRIRARLQFQSEDGKKDSLQTGWLWRVTDFFGPTDMRRGRRFGVDWPLPEVGSLVVVFFNGGNVHDGYYVGQPNYWEGETGAPELEKDKHPDWNFRVDLQNGFSLGVDTEGNVELVVPGTFRVKLQTDAEVTARGEMSIAGTNLELNAKAVLRLLGVTTDHTPYPRPDEAGEIRERAIDMYAGPPGRKDPKIGKIPDIEE